MSARDRLVRDAVAILADLVAFDTTSDRSNLELIAYVERRLDGLGIGTRRVASADGRKANLIATLGPAVDGGIVLSGHTDVVPVDGQPWTSNPFELHRRGDRFYGRGASDMKGFIALALAAAPDFARDACRPVHFAFSYDEELGCLGAPDMIDLLAREFPAPACVIVGEPTRMRIVSAHKASRTYRAAVHGRAAHSSTPHLGVSANSIALRLMRKLDDIAEELRRGEGAPGFEPAYSTLTIGTIRGGNAINIIARDCVFQFDLRTPSGHDVDAILAPFFALVRQLDGELREKGCAGVDVVRLAFVPSLEAERGGKGECIARRVSGNDAAAQYVSYGTEAGQFQMAGFSTVICGPGSIDQAHKPDEYIELSQLELGADFMLRLADLSRAQSAD